MSTRAEFRDRMSQRGLLLPAALVNPLNADAQAGELRALVAMAVTARAVNPDVDMLDPDAVYATLDDSFALAAAGVFSFEEAFGYFKAVHAEKLRSLSPPDFPMPDLPTPDGIDLNALEAAERARYVLEDDALDGLLAEGMAEAQLEAFASLMDAVAQRARVTRPERVGTDRSDHEEPFPIGLPPTDEEPDLSLMEP